MQQGRAKKKTQSNEVYGEYNSLAKKDQPITNYLYAFDLYIDSIKLQTNGYFYFLWRKGSKIAQSLKYNSQRNTLTVIKETLCLNLTLQTRHGQPIQKNTSLLILSSEAQVLDEINLAVHRWSDQFTNITISLKDRGSIQAKVRSRMLMKIDEKIILRDEEECGDAIDDWRIETNIEKIKSKYNMKPNYEYIDDEKDEITKLRKQLEDTLYYNSKLKNDRNILISQNISLQGELKVLKKAMKQQIEGLEKHAKAQLQIRQTVYEEQIDKLIQHFNSNTEQTFSIMKNLVIECEQSRKENKIMKSMLSKQKTQLEEFQQNLTLIQSEKNSLSAAISDLQSKHKDLFLENSHLKKTIQELTNELVKTAEDKDDLNKKILELSLDLQTSNSERRRLEEEMDKLREHSDNLEMENRNYADMVEKLSEELESNKFQLQFTENTYKKEREQNEIKEQCYRAHIKKLQAIIQDLQAQLEKLKQKEEKVEPPKAVSQRQIAPQKQIQKEKQIIVESPKKQQVQQKVLAPPPIQEKKQQKIEILDKSEKLAIKINQNTLEQYSLEIEILKKQIDKLLEENNRLQEFIDKMGKEYISIHQYKQIADKLKEVQGSLAEVQKNSHNISEINESQFSLGPAKKTFNLNKQAERERVDELLQRVEKLENEKVRLEQQKEEFKKKYDLLTVEMAKKYAEAQRQKQIFEQRIKQIKIVEYCDSEDQENKKIAEKVIAEYQKIMKNKIDELIEEDVNVKKQKDQRGKSATSKKVSAPELQQSGKMTSDQGKRNVKKSIKISKKSVKKFNSLDRPFEEYDFGEIQKDLIEQESVMSGVIDCQENQNQQIPVIDSKKNIQIQKIKPQISRDRPFSEDLQQQTKQEQSKHSFKIPNFLFGGNISEKSSAKETSEKKKPIKFDEEDRKAIQNVEKPNPPLTEEVSIVKSGDISERSKKSRESYVSKQTIYMFQKVSHREKIDRLTADVESLKKLKAESDRIAEELRVELADLTQSRNKIQAELKNEIQEGKVLKQSLLVESEKVKEKENIEKLNKHTQTQVQRQSKHVEAQIPDPVLISTTKELEEAKILLSIKQNQYLKKLEQNESYIKVLMGKLNDAETKNDILIKKYETLELEYEKMRKEDQKLLRQNKQAIQALKMEKNQLEYDNNNLKNEEKKLKTRVEELEEKLKKNDVMDLLRQTQFQAENSSKKIIQLNRNIYQLKLEKETIEDEGKLLRKKYSDGQKKLAEAEDSIDRLEKSLDEAKRKESRSKRQIEDKEDTISKVKDQIKKLNEQIASTKAYYMQQEFEKKKIYDQLQFLQNSMQQKDYEINNLKKEIERMRKKLQDKEDEKIDKKSELRRQIQRLEQMLVSKEKEIIELEAVNKQLNHKLQNQITEHKRLFEQKTSLFSEKLRIYVSEITDMKKSHEENMYEIDALRNSLNETHAELQMTKTNYAKLEEKYEETFQTAEEFRQLLNNEKKESENIREYSKGMEAELINIKTSIKLMKEDLEREKKNGVNKKQQMEVIKKENQELMQKLGKLKIKLSEYETQNAITRNYCDKLNEQEKQSFNYQKQIRELKITYEQYRAKYQHTPHQLDAAVRKTQLKAKEKYELQINLIKEGYDSQIVAQKKKLESQIVSSLNQISRIKHESQKKSEYIGQLQTKISKFEMLPLKLQEMETLYQQKENELSKMRSLESEHQKLLDKISRLEELCSQSYRDKEQLAQALAQSKIKNKQLQNYVDQFQSFMRSTDSENKDLQAKIAVLVNSEINSKNQKELLERKLKEYEEQIEELKKKIGKEQADHAKKVSSLEQKLEMMAGVVNEHGKVLESSYQEYFNQHNIEIEELHTQILSKNNTISDLENLVDKLNIQVEQTKREGEKIRLKLGESQQFFQIEVEKYRNKLNETQKMYKATIKDLQGQLEQTMNQLTSLKMKNLSEKQLRTSKSEESFTNTHLINIQRLEDKLKNKSDKVEELEQNIFVLEQTIMKLKKNTDIPSNKGDKIATLELQNKELSLTLKSIETQNQNKINQLKQTINQLRNQLQQSKRAIEELQFQLEQKGLGLQSIDLQLKTTKALYQDLQSQLDKRKDQKYFSSEELQNINKELMSTRDKLSDMEIHYGEMKENIHHKELQIDRKTHIITTLQVKVNELEKSQNKLKHTLQNKINQDGQHYKTQIKRLTDEYEAACHENKLLKEEKQRLEKQNWQFSTQLSITQNSIGNLSVNLEEMASKNKELEQELRKYYILQEKCHKNFRITLQEAFSHNYLLSQLEEKEFELSSLAEEVDQLKFLHERKLMDYDELRKQNYELKIKSEDAEFASQQVQELREICDKLEQEKKDANFKLQFFMMQFETIMSSCGPQIRQRLEDVVRRSKNPF